MDCQVIPQTVFLPFIFYIQNCACAFRATVPYRDREPSLSEIVIVFTHMLRKCCITELHLISLWIYFMSWSLIISRGSRKAKKDGEWERTELEQKSMNHFVIHLHTVSLITPISVSSTYSLPGILFLWLLLCIWSYKEVSLSKITGLKDKRVILCSVSRNASWEQGFSLIPPSLLRVNSSLK